MFLDASGFHAGSFAPTLSGRKVHPVYRLHSFLFSLEFGCRPGFRVNALDGWSG